MFMYGLWSNFFAGNNSENAECCEQVLPLSMYDIVEV